MNKFLAIVVLLCTFSAATAQQTVGLLSFSQANTYQGYTLIYPHNQSTVFLLDNCGEIVHTWVDDTDVRPGNTAYLLEDGRLLKTKRSADISQDAIWAGGGGDLLEIWSWDNELLWSYKLNNENFRLHHDVTITDDGNILAIAWEKKTEEEALAAGRDPATMTQGELWPDYIFEIDPTTDEIVWEWHAWDHLVQDYDQSSPNFGVVADNQRRINLNWDTNGGKADWLHMNSIDYNPILDHIMVSVPQFNEVWVIDHSTTTAQAAGSTGGKSNHGGDIIYRVGNPQTYDQGTEEDQIFHFQHDAHWLLDLPTSHPMYGLVAIFNNRAGDDYSTAEIFETPWMDYITDYQQFDNTWPPYDLDNTITHPIKEEMYSTGMSSIQVLPNGNNLICSGRQGYIFELDPDGELVWEYKTPLKAGNPVDQGEVLEDGNNPTFRAHKYSMDFAAFENRDLSSKGFIETNPDVDYCVDLISSVSKDVMTTSISPNPATDMVKVRWDSGEIILLRVTDIGGKIVIEETANGGNHYLNTSMLQTGMYFLHIDNQYVKKLLIR